MTRDHSAWHLDLDDGLTTPASGETHSGKREGTSSSVARWVIHGRTSSRPDSGSRARARSLAAARCGLRAASARAGGSPNSGTSRRPARGRRRPACCRVRKTRTTPPWIHGCPWHRRRRAAGRRVRRQRSRACPDPPVQGACDAEMRSAEREPRLVDVHHGDICTRRAREGHHREADGTGPDHEHAHAGSGHGTAHGVRADAQGLDEGERVQFEHGRSVKLTGGDMQPLTHAAVHMHAKHLNALAAVAAPAVTCLALATVQVGLDGAAVAGRDGADVRTDSRHFPAQLVSKHAGYLKNGCRPRHAWKSVPHTPTRRMRTSAMPTPGGPGTSVSVCRSSPGSLRTMVRMMCPAITRIIPAPHSLSPLPPLPPLTRLSPFERPVPRSPGPDEEDGDAERQRAEAEEDHERIGGGEQEDPAEQRDQRRHRVEPHAERPRHVGLRRRSSVTRDDLADELDQDARRDQRVDHHAEREACCTGSRSRR